jgi:hypothetical protein
VRVNGSPPRGTLLIDPSFDYPRSLVFWDGQRRAKILRDNDTERKPLPGCLWDFYHRHLKNAAGPLTFQLPELDQS